MSSFAPIIRFIRELYAQEEGVIPLHTPTFAGKEKEYLEECIDTTFVSSVGAFVDRFECELREYTGAESCVVTVNGTAALHISLVVAGVKPGEIVLTQGLTFVATANAIRHTNGIPVFLDSDPETLGMCPNALRSYLEVNAKKSSGSPRHLGTGKRIAACLPVHIVGHSCRINEIASVCHDWSIPLVEDAAEGVGSRNNGQHLGTFGLIGALSFNGNKIITTGGGGAILSRNKEVGRIAKHLTTTAKAPHSWEYFHDSVAWNYRMPNVNAALGCAQMELVPALLEQKRRIAAAYRDFFSNTPWQFVDEPKDCESNFWLCSVAFRDKEERDAFLKYSNAVDVMSRPLWRLMPDLPMFSSYEHDGLKTARMLTDRIVNLPSSVPPASLRRSRS